MQPHQQRVVDEKKDLNEKLDKLKAFIEESPVFKNLHADERGRLGRQFDVMAEYSSILSQRIAAFQEQPCELRDRTRSTTVSDV